MIGKTDMFWGLYGEDGFDGTPIFGAAPLSGNKNREAVSPITRSNYMQMPYDSNSMRAKGRK